MPSLQRWLARKKLQDYKKSKFHLCRIPSLCITKTEILQESREQKDSIQSGACVDVLHLPVPGQHEHLPAGCWAEVRLVPSLGWPANAVHAQGQVSYLDTAF